MLLFPLPPAEEFSAPVYDQVHQEQIAASEMTVDFAEIPVMHEQVIVGLRPERLVDAQGPQGCWSVRLPRVPWCPLSRCRRRVTMLVTTLPRLSSCSGAPWLREREREGEGGRD